jgi:hypothetical protein
VGLLTHTPHDQHYWAWFVDINGGWPDSENINTLSGHHISDVGLLTHTPHDQHYWAWFVDINGGWPDSGNINTLSGHHISDVGLLTHTPHDQHTYKQGLVRGHKWWVAR